MDYQRQMEKITDYIGEHLDEKLTLDQLSEVACFSKYHFHRLFTVYTGLSLQQYIRWLRLKRAAHQLIVEQSKSIIEIAIGAGFESHESFTRAFKQACGLNPKEFRAQLNWQDWEKPPFRLPQQGDIKMNVDIKEMKERRLAVIEHRGDPKTLAATLRKITSWMKTKNLAFEVGEVFGFAYDDPKTTPPDEFRYDLGITIAESLQLDGEMLEKRLPAGRYAAAMHKGSRETIAETVYSLYCDWLPKSGEELGDLPCIFSFYSFDFEVAETALITECRLLLK